MDSQLRLHPSQEPTIVSSPLPRRVIFVDHLSGSKVMATSTVS